MQAFVLDCAKPVSVMFGLAQYVADGLIGSYMMPSESLEDIFNITQSVRLTAVKTAGPAELLAIKPLSDFVEDFLSSHIFTESFSNLADGRSCDLLDRSASQLISLYNSALDYLMDKAVDVSLREISWPAQKMLVTEIEKMKLPEFEDCCALSGLLC